MLTPRTTVFIIDKKDGSHSESTLGGWFNSLNGGSKWEDYEVTIDPAEANKLRMKYSGIRRMRQLLENMTPDQVDQAIDVIQGREDLMTTAEQYS